MSKSTYRATNPEAVFAAGVRIREDRTVELSDEQARYELLAGTIERLDPEAKPVKRSRAEPSEG